MSGDSEKLMFCFFFFLFFCGMYRYFNLIILFLDYYPNQNVLCFIFWNINLFEVDVCDI